MHSEIQVRCVGRLQETWHKEAVHMYATRCSPFGKLTVLEVKEGHGGSAKPDVAKTLKNEAADLLDKLPKDALLVALDEHGTKKSTADFAQWLAGHSDRPLVFVIGGSWGLDQTVLDRADMTLSLGAMTLPHALARIVLMEQIYRADMINGGRKYHK